MVEEEVVSVSYKKFVKQLEHYNEQIPNIAIKLMRAVNNKAKAAIRREAKNRGYSAHTSNRSFDTGYSANLVSYANRDFSGKISVRKNGFYYRFIESGTKNRQTKGKQNRGAIVARPFIKPIAGQYWETSKGLKIIKDQFQKELKKIFKD